MPIMEIAVIGILAVLVVILFAQISKNSKLKSENKKLYEILEVKNTTISNYEASRVAVKDVIENFSSLISSITAAIAVTAAALFVGTIEDICIIMT